MEGVSACSQEGCVPVFKTEICVHCQKQYCWLHSRQYLGLDNKYYSRCERCQNTAPYASFQSAPKSKGSPVGSVIMTTANTI